MGIINCINDYSEDKEISKKPVKISQGKGIFKSGIKTEIISEIKEYKEIDILSFRERKNLAKELLNKGTEENIDKALEYDNTSFNIILKNSKQQENFELLQIFDIKISKTQFEILLLDIINSNNWEKETFLKKFNEYKQEINSRFKFNQPLDGDNEALFWYKSKIHILINLIEKDDILHFKKKLQKKRDIYNKIEITKIIENDQYPKDMNKLKLFMIILILVNDEEYASYMFNSICDENYNTEYYFNKIIQLKLVDKKIISYDKNNIYIQGMEFNEEKYSFASLINCLKKDGLKKISLTNELLYKYEYFLNEYYLNEYLLQFKEIIKAIIKSKYYSTILSELFNKNKKEIYFIQKDEFIDYLISKINIIPISIYDVPFSDKFSLEIFLGGYDSLYIDLREANGYGNEISTIMKLGNNTVNIIHEGGGHFIYSYFTLISNNFYNLASPKIKINNELIQNESGEQVELLLFGRIIEKLKLKEALFILNTKNHNIYNHFDEFRENFIKSNKKKYAELVENFEGPFTELIKSIKWEKVGDNKDFPISIACKNNRMGQPFIVLSRKSDDALGKYYWK